MMDCKNWELDNGHCYYCTEHNKQDCEFYKPTDDRPARIIGDIVNNCSVTNKPETIRWIDASYLINILENEEEAYGYVCYYDVMQAPTITRCKHCEYFENCSIYETANFNPDSYCSKAVHKVD